MTYITTFPLFSRTKTASYQGGITSWFELFYSATHKRNGIQQWWMGINVHIPSWLAHAPSKPFLCSLKTAKSRQPHHSWRLFNRPFLYHGIESEPERFAGLAMVLLSLWSSCLMSEMTLKLVFAKRQECVLQLSIARESGRIYEAIIW